jgi:omega-6 fatty acid desaturase (delta-12 desaturase)
MDARSEDGVRRAIAQFTLRRNGLAISVVAFDFAVYVTSICLAAAANSIWLKAVFAIVAGVATGSLFILGHDAAHDALVSNKVLNRLLARILFLPSLHNFSLWRLVHNREHHALTNVKGLNSFSPLSSKEFAAATFPRRAMEVIYRSAAGLGVYYLIERWWKFKFFPKASRTPRQRVAAKRDFGLILIWLISLVFVLSVVGSGSVLSSIWWGILLPFAVWNQLMGTTVYLQHTHPEVAWFCIEGEPLSTAATKGQAVFVQSPRWFDIISHNTMHHPAHHANPKIPWYGLRSAQEVLCMLEPKNIIFTSLTLRALIETTGRCKLYDYSGHQWLDFSGRPTLRAFSDSVSQQSGSVPLVETT